MGLSGFDGGELPNVANESYIANQHNYPSVEALHQIFLDCVAFSLWRKNE